MRDVSWGFGPRLGWRRAVGAGRVDSGCPSKGGRMGDVESEKTMMDDRKLRMARGPLIRLGPSLRRARSDDALP